MLWPCNFVDSVFHSASKAFSKFETVVILILKFIVKFLEVKFQYMRSTGGNFCAGFRAPKYRSIIEGFSKFETVILLILKFIVKFLEVKFQSLRSTGGNFRAGLGDPKYPCESKGFQNPKPQFY